MQRKNLALSFLIRISPLFYNSTLSILILFKSVLSILYKLVLCINGVIYVDKFDKESKKVLDESTCYLVSDVLNQVMKKNIYSIILVDDFIEHIRSTR